MKKCNVWINDRPNIDFKVMKVLNEEILKDKWIRWDSISYLIEVNILCRHCSNYALLGMTFTYEDSNKLIVEVKSGDKDGPVINNTLVSESDEVHAGIPLEYSEEVLKCAKSYLNSINCSSGIITFDIGGHGYIGSSEIMFKQVTEILLKLLNNKSGEDIHEIEKIVFQQLNPG